MRLLLMGRHYLKPLLQVDELLEQIIDYLDYPSIVCLMMSNKNKFGMNSSLIMMNPNLWVNQLIRYDCVDELMSRHATFSGMEDIEDMNEEQRKDFSVKCREILTEHVQAKLKKYKLIQADSFCSRQLCKACGEFLIEEGELIVLYSIEGKVACYNEYFHWDCLTVEEMKRRNIKRSEIECSSNSLMQYGKVDKVLRRVDESRELKRQQLFGVVCDRCMKFQSSRYYSGLDLDGNRLDLCMDCFSEEGNSIQNESLEKRKPSLIICKICKDPIKDAVFSCQYCEYYSLCRNCFEKIPNSNLHFSHPFTLVGCNENDSSGKHTEKEITPLYLKKRKFLDDSGESASNKKVSLFDTAKSMGFEDLSSQ